MAFQVLGSEFITWAAGTNPAAQNITIPATCNAVYAFWSYYDGDTIEGISTFTLNSLSADEAVESATGSTERGGGVSAWYDPSTGSQTLDVAWDGAPDEGPTTTVVYVEDADTTGWRDAQVDAEPTSTAASITLTSTSADIAIMHNINDTDGGIPGLQTGFTSLQLGSNNFEGYRTAYDATPGDPTQVCTAQAPVSATLVVGVIVKQQAAGAPIVIEVDPAGTPY
jgi:hypothetical protein